MIAHKKIQAAEYHLATMKEKYLKDEQLFIYELEAFLANIRSIPDVLLEDYNQKFGLGITLTDKLYPSTFRKRANLIKNPKVRRNAKDFLNWWKGEKSKINSNPLVSLFFNKRNVSIHRTELRADLKKVTVTASITVSASVTIIKRDKQGNIIDNNSLDKKENTKSKPRSTKPKIEDIKLDWCFSDYPDENILDASKKLLDIMKRTVLDAETKFPY